MSKPLMLAALAAAVLCAGPALADDEADCNTGIEFIEAEIAKNPAEPELGQLKEALSDAKREAEEAEFDECLDAVQEAKDAVGAN